MAIGERIHHSDFCVVSRRNIWVNSWDSVIHRLMSALHSMKRGTQSKRKISERIG